MGERKIKDEKVFDENNTETYAIETEEKEREKGAGEEKDKGRNWSCTLRFHVEDEVLA